MLSIYINLVIMSQNSVQEYHSKESEGLVDQILVKIKTSLSEENRKKLYQAFVDGMEETDMILEYIESTLQEIGPEFYKYVKKIAKSKFGKYLVPVKATKQFLSFIAKCLKEKIQNDPQFKK